MWTALSLFTAKEGPGAWCKVELASFLEAFRALGERNLPPEDIPNIVIQQLYEEFGFVKQSADTETLQHVFQEQVRRRLKLGEEESEVPAQLKEQERAWTKLETDLAKLWATATKKQGPMPEVVAVEAAGAQARAEAAGRGKCDDGSRRGRKKGVAGERSPGDSYPLGAEACTGKSRDKRGHFRDSTRHCLRMCCLISLSWPHLWLSW